jgi:hypothetical protein
MSEEVIKKYKEYLGEISKYLKECNFRACNRLAVDLIRLSYYFDFSDGIFFAEYMENIFDNLRELNRDYELDKEDINEIIDKNAIFLNTLKESISQLSKNINKIYELMRDARVSVTNLQFKYSRTRVEKRVFPPITITEG